MSTSPVTLVLSVAALATYGYAVYYLNFNPNLQKMHNLIPEKLRPYGMNKFLTYQCLLVQTLNAALHIAAFFSKAFIKPRDFVFTALASPIGSIVVYTFWGVWHLLSRELIFPVAIDEYYPNWLNHTTHTIIVPVNFLLGYLVNHKFSNLGAVFTLLYLGIYSVFLQYIKINTGISVYKYLDTMSDTERYIYFLATALFAFIMYKTGQMCCGFFHPTSVDSKTLRSKTAKKGQKQK